MRIAVKLGVCIKIIHLLEMFHLKFSPLDRLQFHFLHHPQVAVACEYITFTQHSYNIHITPTVSVTGLLGYQCHLLPYKSYNQNIYISFRAAQ